MLTSRIKSEEVQDFITGGEFDVPDKSTTNEIPGDTEKPKENIISGTILDVSLSPKEISQKKFYDTEAEKQQKLIEFFNTLKTCAKILTAIIGVIIVVLSVYWAYNLSSIAEPMGTLKEKVNNFEIEKQKLEDRIKTTEDKITETREEFFKTTN